MWIENISMQNAREAYHFDPGVNSMLIQITDPDTTPPAPGYAHFAQIHQFRFWDSEEDHPESISPEQADEIARLLIHAHDKRMNVIVHCHAGVCRSGAVAESAIALLGFQDVEAPRIPNLRVKQMVMERIMFYRTL